MISAALGVLVLYVEDVRDFWMGLEEEWGMETLVRSAVVSVVPGSAYRPFLLDSEVALDAEDKV